ncbi:MAG: RNA methyltransferase [Oscillospiraceae bacterium]|nr:RNA methyltransferase [Oscillospiraceae bacterium]
MAEIVEITDLSSPELDVYVRLTEAQLRCRRDPEKALFIAESLPVIAAALEAGCEPVSLLAESRRARGLPRELLDRCGEVPVFTGDEALLRRLTGFTLTRGILCAMRRPPERSAGEVCAGAKRIAVLEGIVDGTNLGAVFRSAAALGMDAVLLSPTCADPLLRRAARVSMGTVFAVPWARLGSGADWPEKSLGYLREQGFVTAALALDSSALSVTDPSLHRAEKLALLLGTEGTGLTPAALAGCDCRVMIPMARGVDSLNVAAAAAVAFWELRYRE